MRVVAVDIGGTMIKSGLWNGETFVELRETETRASEGGAALMERVKGLIHSYHDFEAIGISTAGEVNTEDGSIFYANSNIPGTRPLLSPCAMMTAPIMRVVEPQDVWNGYCTLLSRPVNVTL